MLSALMGTKLGMTQYLHENGLVSGVTAVEVGPCTVTQVKTDSTDGYSAVQIGFMVAAARKLTGAQRGHLQKRGLGLFRHLQEVHSTQPEPPVVGAVVTVDQLFAVGDEVDVIGTSKGKGFAGGIKRYHFSGGPKTHGQGDRWRAPGSVGAGTTPGRVVKGHKMAGQMGNKQITQKRGRVVAIDATRHLLFIRGSIPGAARGLVLVRRRGLA
ncbi:MAG: 50S ribosomal protein L3 [Chloroflexi bacterium]|nr:50S ribosomal protein L3 [Chloroflexota bacterium]